VKRRWRVLAVVSVAVFMASLDLFIVNIAFADIGRDFSGASTAALSWVLNTYAIVFAAALVPAGRLADRFGHRRGFLLGCLVFVLGSALCGLAPSLEVLVGARMLQALGAALVTPTSLALLLPEFPPEQRAVAIGAWAAVGGIAAAFGPPLGGVLVEASWRLVFLVNVPVGLGAVIVGVRLLRESRDEAGSLPDLLGTAVLAASVAAVALALVKAPEWGWGGLRTLGCLAFGLVAMGLFWARCHRHPSPVVDPDILRVRSFALACLAMLLFGSAFAAMLLGSVLYLTQVWHDSILTAGLSLAPGPLMAAAMAVPAGHLAHRLGARYVAATGCVVFAAGCTWWAWRMGVEPNFLGALLPGMLATGLGVGLTLAPLSSAASSSLPPARFATGIAVFTMARQIGAVLGVAILIAVLAAPPDWQAGWVFMTIASACAAAAALGIGVVHDHVAGDQASTTTNAATAPVMAVGR
jgi:EmrB/QacA subfamily drug resistance transporter